MTMRQGRYTTGLLMGFVGVMVVGCWAAWWARPVRADRIAREPTGMVIDVNRADADTLALLPGIGPRVARRIVDYRQRHGRFERVQGLDEVAGIGAQTLNKIAPHVACLPAGSAPGTGVQAGESKD
jgi:competence protein ComEA